VAPDAVRPEPETPRWLADAMLGKLARYLRFLGHDTLYVATGIEAGLPNVAGAEPRTVLTRDRGLAARTEGALLLRSSEVRGQLREVHARFPMAPFEVRFDRCPECNARLLPWPVPAEGATWPLEPPTELVRAGLPVAECPGCHRHYWEGTHARRIRTVVAEAIATEAAR
jgi:uncharacterized protein